jgi:hypothetical protein
MLNAPLRPILIRNNVIYALYNILSNWSSGTISVQHLVRKKTPTNSRLLGSSQPKPTQRTTTTPTAADSYPSSLDDGARIYDLRRAMCAWRADPVNGRTRLVKDIAREHAASDREITRAFLRVSGGFFPNPFVYKDLDAYVAAWRDAVVKALRAYMATSDHLLSVVLDRRRDEACFLRWNGGKAAKKPPKARAHRAWRRNAERMQRNWTRSL